MTGGERCGNRGKRERVSLHGSTSLPKAGGSSSTVHHDDGLDAEKRSRRSDVQARYRQRILDRLRALEQSIALTREEMKAIKADSEELQTRVHAMQAMNMEAAELGSIVARSMAHGVVFPSAAAGISVELRTAQELVLSVWVHGKAPPSSTLEVCKVLPFNLLLTMEKNHMLRLAHCWRQYMQEPDSRPQLENIINAAMQVRRNIAVILANALPNVYIRISEEVVPSLATFEGRQAMVQLEGVVRSFALPKEKRQKILEVWNCYETEIATIHEETEVVKQRLSTAAGVAGMLAGGNATVAQSDCAKEFLSAAACAERLQKLMHRRIEVYGMLNIRSFSELNWQQHTLLHVACAPFTPCGRLFCSNVLMAQ